MLPTLSATAPAPHPTPNHHLCAAAGLPRGGRHGEALRHGVLCQAAHGTTHLPPGLAGRRPRRSRPPGRGRLLPVCAAAARRAEGAAAARGAAEGEAAALLGQVPMPGGGVAPLHIDAAHLWSVLGHSRQASLAGHEVAESVLQVGVGRGQGLGRLRGPVGKALACLQGGIQQQGHAH